MIKSFVVLISAALPAGASVAFTCNELERVSLSAAGSMRPVYEGRTLNFVWEEENLSGDGVFYHQSYSITAFGEGGFRAFAQHPDRSDLFRFEKGILMHTAIVKYGREPSIQSQIFECTVVAEPGSDF